LWLKIDGKKEEKDSMEKNANDEFYLCISLLVPFNRMKKKEETGMFV
jgi:hypothetical protein